MLTQQRPETPTIWSDGGAKGRPILLATLDVPFEPAAATFAVDSAVESGQTLIVCNVTELAPLPMSVIMRYDALDYPPELEQSLLAPALLANSLGVRVERLRLKSLRPIEALIELASERQPGLLVFGPDRSKLRPRAYRRAARKVVESVGCLVWMAP